jgi:hypothetical protein
MAIIIWCLLGKHSSWLQILIYITGTITVISSIKYFYDFLKQLEASPTSGPLSKQDKP